MINIIAKLFANRVTVETIALSNQIRVFRVTRTWTGALVSAERTAVFHGYRNDRANRKAAEVFCMDHGAALA
jgi:hypothetical protein